MLWHNGANSNRERLRRRRRRRRRQPLLQLLQSLFVLLANQLWVLLILLVLLLVRWHAPKVDPRPRRRGVVPLRPGRRGAPRHCRAVHRRPQRVQSESLVGVGVVVGVVVAVVVEVLVYTRGDNQRSQR